MRVSTKKPSQAHERVSSQARASGSLPHSHDHRHSQLTFGNHALGEILQCKKGTGKERATGTEATESSRDYGHGTGTPRNESDTGKVGRPSGIPARIRTALEALSGIDLSGVRVHRNSPKPAELNALAYTQGQDIYLEHGQDRLLPHEGWHVVQQRQGRVGAARVRANGVAVNDDVSLESEADRMATRVSAQPLAERRRDTQSNFRSANHSNQTVQRKVRIDGGATRVNEAQYKPGGAKSAVGSKRSVAALIADGVKRVFTDAGELEDYANGKTDYIGDVAPASAPKSWYRLPKDKLTVLGEFHQDPQGNVEDVILGLGTSRFMYEPFNELPGAPAHDQPFTSTQARVAQVNKGIAVNTQVDRTKFSPDLENIVIKAITGAAITRNEYIPSNPATLNAAGIAKWGRRASVSDYSYGERAALYLSIGIHLASDVAKNTFGPPNLVESFWVKSARKLQQFYLNNQTVLDQFKTKKDGDDLIGIYELTKPDGFKNLTVIKDFTLALHEYGSRYIEELGFRSGNKKLQGEGKALTNKPDALIDDLSPAREEIMWNKIQNAKGYLIVGMGDAHRQNLKPRLAAAGIPAEEVQASIAAQNAEVAAKWKP